MNRKHNFCAGPSTLPLEVLEEMQSELVDYQGAGLSLIEMSHRALQYDAVHRQAKRLALEVWEVPPEFDVLFIQGGASLQFAMVPLNLLGAGQCAGYVDTGSWAKGAMADARTCGDIYSAWDGSAQGERRVPDDAEIAVRDGTRYLHITSNETIDGIRFPEFPAVGVPLVADMSSELMARRIPWERFDIVYGGVQKNLGPAGMAMVFIRKEVACEPARPLARYLRYDVHSSKESLFNTPPMFAIAMVGKVLRWMRSQGGIEAMERNAQVKADLLYKEIDESEGFYSCPVDARCRSLMNVVFRLPDQALEGRFLAAADERGLLNLKGHRSVGGCRASLYNAMPREGVVELAELMRDFRRDH
ncbi:3-phosphoserine/phosphohydroxythreonine transaminase [Thioalkalivibrio sp. HK1]|uniref:3-phosphoserine/phosphohydroxythreonine transaminase n=1 Tax=Thioalkalivibrio sp. HK1 TaxID=1469245 RepID=UPI00046FF269|nr:3-phosphoserine/phosphohydroxythreonine transaminase [Thioalkalivibrio sp. HK1]